MAKNLNGWPKSKWGPLKWLSIKPRKMNQDDINRKRVADLAVHRLGVCEIYQPSSLRLKHTPIYTGQHKVSSTLFTLRGTSKLMYMFAKATLRVNFTFDGFPHFFFLRGSFNWKRLNTSTFNAWSFVTSSCCLLRVPSVLLLLSSSEV